MSWHHAFEPPDNGSAAAVTYEHIRDQLTLCGPGWRYSADERRFSWPDWLARCYLDGQLELAATAVRP